MNNDNYNKRELDMKFESVIEKVDELKADTKDQIESLVSDSNEKHEQNTIILNDIKDKVSFTNGKVKKLEKWQAGLIMAGSTALFMGAIIISLVVYIYQYQLSQQASRITSLRAAMQSAQLK